MCNDDIINVIIILMYINIINEMIIICNVIMY